MNRRLIRSSLSEIKDKITERAQKKRVTPPAQTNAETFYYLKQMQNKTPMVLVFHDGEQLHGIIDWYDRNSLKVNRDPEPNLLVFKHSIRYMYKEDEVPSNNG